MQSRRNLRFQNKSSQSSKKKDLSEANKFPADQNLGKDESVGPDNKSIPSFKLKPNQKVDEGIQINPNLIEQTAQKTAKKDIGTQFTFEDGRKMLFIKISWN